MTSHWGVTELLVAAAIAGDAAAWEELVDRYAGLVWSVCRRYRLTDADAADVSQTVWLRTVERLDRLREARRDPPRRKKHVEGQPGGDPMAAGSEGMRRRRTSLMKLSDEQRKDAAE